MEENSNLTKPVKGNAIYLSLGSNLGDRKGNLTRAREAIRQQIGEEALVSKIYQSEAWGYSSPHGFYNCCVELFCSLEPLALLNALLAIEESMGRTREGGGYADRIIDIDLLFYGDRILEHPRLILPHPALERRRFVLVPLAEIAPELVHPRSGLNILEMLDRCPDQALLSPLEES